VSELVPPSPTTIARPIVLSPRLQEVHAGWLLRCKSAHTREAYARDFTRWAGFLEGHGVDLLAANLDHVAAYMRVSEQESDPRTGRPISPATVARRVAVVSSFYRHARRHGLIAHNPAEDVDRPELDPDHSETVGMTEDEAQRLLRTAAQVAADAATARSRRAALRDAAIVSVMLCTGGRVTEVTRAHIEDLGYDRGYRVLFVTRKGGRRQAIPLGATAELIDRYVHDEGRTTGLLFRTTSGRQVDRSWIFRVVQRLAVAAHIPAGRAITPHSARHTFATLALDHGATLDEVQDAMGHADPRTTRRYDRARNRLDRSPVHKVAARLLTPGPAHGMTRGQQ
jgi:integrase/recombinase XerD